MRTSVAQGTLPYATAVRPPEVNGTCSEPRARSHGKWDAYLRLSIGKVVAHLQAGPVLTQAPLKAVDSSASAAEIGRRAATHRAFQAQSDLRGISRSENGVGSVIGS
jgi:hypothetical protein